MYIKSNKEGLVLVAVLWVGVLLTLIIVTAARSSRLDTKICLSSVETIRCKWACRAGINKAVAVLNEDRRESDCLTDPWSNNDRDFNDVSLQECSFSVAVVDEASKLNVNTTTKEQLLALPDMTKEIAAAIIDWRDSDDMPTEGGAEGKYYENLAFGYAIRNGPFRTIRELLLVKGITEDMFYGEDTNYNGRLDYNERDGDKNPPADNGDDNLDRGLIEYLTCYSYEKNEDGSGRERININEADEDELVDSLNIKNSQARWIVENRRNRRYDSIAALINKQSPKESPPEDSNTAEPMDLKTFSSIADRITISNNRRIRGKINVNTAPKIVLAALLGGDDNAGQLAANIIAYRQSLTSGMSSIAEVMKAESIDVETFKRIANYITVRSNVFTVRSFSKSGTAKPARASLKTEAVVDRGLNPCQTLYWYQGADD